jgi:hypothetical protein
MRRIVVLAAAVFAFHTAAALASSQQESILMDDSEFVYADAQHVDQRMAEAKALGFDRIRVSVYWRLLAPSPDSKTKPSGDLSDPASYGQGKWDRYDRIVQLANAHGLGVLFTLTGPSPLWATGTPEQGRSDVEDTWNPSAADFKEFVTAVGRRYSGTYQDQHVEPSIIPLLPPTVTKSPPLPRVDHWSIWNEPNHGGWLTPQWDGKPLVPQSPRIYRGLVDGAWGALQSTGHGSDTILIGETAPGGLNPGLTRGLRPLPFVRELYCLNRKLRPYKGSAAKARGCPASFNAGSFVGAHPGLFAASGWAHHPYSLITSPRTADKNKDDATLSGITRLTRTLDRAFRVYGQSRRLPIWMTEYGYQTDPPDPTGVSPARQAAWLDDATFIAYRNPRVASFAQFLLLDDGPERQYPPSDPRYWGTFQTGLMTNAGKHKPAYASFKHPISLSPTRVRRGHTVRVFGQLRTAADNQALTAQIQFRPKSSKKWATVGQVAVGGLRAFLDTTVKASRSGAYRIAWSSGGASRAVSVTVVG